MKKVPSQKKEITRSPYPRAAATIVLLLIVFLWLSVPAWADFDFNSGKRPFDIYDIVIPDYYLKNNSFYHYYEYQNKNYSIATHNYIAYRNKSITWEAPLAIFQTRKFDLAAGAQMTGNTFPFKMNLPYIGLRGSTYFKNGGIMAYWGNSSKADDWLTFAPGLKDYTISGLVAKTCLGKYSSVQAGLQTYKMSGPNEKTNNILQLMAVTQPSTSFNARFAVAKDSRGTGSLFKGDGTAYDWCATYSNEKYNIYGSGDRNGLKFGPDVLYNFNQGQSSQNLTFSYNLSSHFTSSLCYLYFDYANPTTSTLAFSNRSYIFSNQWRMDKQTTLRFGGQKYSNQSYRTGMALTGLDRTEIFASVTRKFSKKFEATAEIRNSNDTNNLTNTSSSFNSFRVSTTYFFSPLHCLSVVYDNYRYFYEGLTNNKKTTSHIGMLYSHQFARDKGYFNLSYNQSEDFNPLNYLPVRNWVTSVNANYWFTRLFNVCGTYYHTETPVTTPGIMSKYTGFTATMRYLLSEHSEMSLNYSSNPIEFIMYTHGMPYPIKNTISLQLRQSFGGPLEKSYRDRWRGTVGARVLYYSKGNPGALFPLSEDMPPVWVSLGCSGMNIISSSTNRYGELRYRDLTPGQYQLVVDTDRLDEHYKLSGGNSLPVNITPGSDRSADIILEAVSSLYVVAFNDLKGTGKLEMPYSGYEGIKVILNENQTSLTDENGIAIFKDLTPGMHTVRIDNSTVPTGVTLSTPIEYKLNLKPGFETVAEFGMQGWGFINGKVFIISKGSAEADKKPYAGVTVLLDGKSLAKSEPDGSFREKIPAGTHKIEISELPNIYQVDKGDVKFKIDPGKEVFKDLLLAYYAKIKGQLYELKNDGREVPLKQGGIVINFSGEPDFMYTNQDGSFLFDKIKIGKYKVTLDQSYIPDNYKLVSANAVNIDITSGDEREVKFILKRVK